MRGLYASALIFGAVALAAPMAMPALGDPAPSTLDALIAGPQRTEANRLRDPYRHPAATLRFFGIEDTMTVVEVWPGGAGWWTEILAPYLAAQGRYYAALPNPAASGEAARGNAAFAKKLAASPALYGKVVVTTMDGDHDAIAPPDSADLILTFRNLHDWMAQGTADAALAAIYRALKPGGIFGVTDHRGAPDKPQDPKAKSGYVREDYAIALIERAGFKFVAKSEINTNPKDTKDYPAGVWSLPPTLRLGAKDRAKYLAIGESDRFTLKFVKPKTR